MVILDHETLLDELLCGVRDGLRNEAGSHGDLSPADPLRSASNRLEYDRLIERADGR